MAFANKERSHDDDEQPRLPGELPAGFRHLHPRSYHDPSQRSSCTSSRERCVAEAVLHGMQENQPLKEEDGGDLFKVVERLDNVIERLMTSCKVKPKVDACMDAGAEAEPFDPRDMEDRLDKVIQKMSQSRYFSRFSKELYTTPTKEDVMNPQPMSSSSRISSLGADVRPPPKAQCEDDLDNAVTPTSSFRLPLLTPRSLLSKFGSSEKVEAFDSPTTMRRQSSGGRSKRFSAALSFLSSPKRAGTVLSCRLGSSKSTDGYSER